jgi:uncharacterized membrane protein (UPF0127 family)
MSAVRNSVFLLLLIAVACTASQTTESVAGCAFDDHAVFYEGDVDQQPLTQLHVSVASDDASRQHGLMGVTNLGKNDGMAFTWTSPTDTTFWMKDTLIPLSIAVVGSDGGVVTIKEMTPCTADPCETYAADSKYTTALEANANWFEQENVEVGDRMTLSVTPCPS